MSSNFKKFLITFNDFSIIILSTFLAYIIRFENFKIIYDLSYKNFLIPLILYLIIFIRYSIYNQVVRFFFIKQINLYFKINLLYLISSVFVYLFFYGFFPRSISVIQPLVFLQLFFISRIFAYFLINLISKKKQLECYLVGINKESISFINNSLQEDYKVTYIFEDNKDLVNRSLNTIKVNSFSLLEQYIKKKSPDIIIAVSDKKKLFKKSIQMAIKYDLRMKKITSDKKHLHLNDYEIEDITLEEIFQTKISNKSFNNKFLNKNIIVTGAGGSIGSEICKQLLNQNVKNLYLLEKDEFSLFNIHAKLVEEKKNTNIHRILIDLKDYDLLIKIFKLVKIDFIFHAAAYKHVSIVEENFAFGLNNNIKITENILKLSSLYNYKNFVLISSDKSVRPSNLMGASKRVCELLIYKYKNKRKDNSNFSIVRFGNVINSTGSVIPIFKKQIEQNKPLTITHKNVSRYFMSIPQAVNLVLHSSVISRNLKIYLLDMGKPIRILELAKKLLKINGIDDNNSNIRIIGLAKGEKIEEELYKDYQYSKTKNKQIHESLEVKPNINQINTLINSINLSIKNHDLIKLKKILKSKLVSYEEKIY